MGKGKRRLSVLTAGAMEVRGADWQSCRQTFDGSFAASLAEPSAEMSQKSPNVSATLTTMTTFPSQNRLWLVACNLSFET